MNESPLDGNRPSNKLANVLLIRIILFLAVLVIGGVWFGIFFNTTGQDLKPSPSPSADSWESSAQKSVQNFLSFWFKANQEKDIVQAQKAKDLLTINAQARLVTQKDGEGNIITDLTVQLNQFIGVDSPPDDFSILSSQKLTEDKVEIRISLLYTESLDKKITLIQEDRLLLINKIEDRFPATPSPTSS